MFSSVCMFQPEALEQIHNLKELWLDNNSLQSIPGVRTVTLLALHLFRLFVFDIFCSSVSCLSSFFCLQSIGKLRQLRYLDLAKNRIETLDTEISGCEALEDLLLSSNMLQHLPDSIGTHTYHIYCKCSFQKKVKSFI